MKIKKNTCFIILASITFLYLVYVTLQLTETRKPSLLYILSNPSQPTSLKSVLNHMQISDKNSSCTQTKLINSEMKWYNLSSNRSYHYEYHYELTKRNVSSNESRLIVLLTGRSRACLDWWEFSEGDKILSHMRSSGFSILAICTSRKDYQITMPIQKNLDVYWIYTTLQIWMRDVYYKHFQHYPRLYLFGLSQGSRMCALLCRVLPVQAQILNIYPGYRPALMIHSDHSKAMQNRLIADSVFANWFYFDYCSKANSDPNNQCPFRHVNKNYFNPVPPTYFVHGKSDPSLSLSDYTSIISDLRENAFNLSSTFLTYNDTIKLHVAPPLNITSEYMQQNFNKWTCKPWSSHFFYEHLTNPVYNARTRKSRTCWCSPTNFKYFERYRNITQTWSETKLEKYRDYINDIQHLRKDLCETLCGNILAMHSMSFRHAENTLSWLDDIDHYQFLYRSEDFLNRPLRLWMYNKSELVHNVTYLTYQTPMNSSCGRYYHANQMYSPEYFLQDYFQRLKELYPLSRHNLIWTMDPLLADYYIIPHDYACISVAYYRPTVTDSEYRSFHISLNQDYFLPLLTNVRTRFPYWNMTSGSNHILPFTIGKNMGLILDSRIRDTLKHVIQLGFSGFRQDLLPHNSPPLYGHRHFTTVYRHNYDIILPSFNRIQWMNDKPSMITSDLNMWYKMKKSLLFFAGTVNNSNAVESVRKRLSLLIQEDIGKGKRYEDEIAIDGKQFSTIVLIDGVVSPTDYVQSIRSSCFNLCPEGFSPWSPRLYESICLGTIPIILAESIVLPFERFINWRSFSTKINVNNVRNIIDLIMKIDDFEEYVKQKLQNATQYFHAFRWPYSPINHNHDRHVFLPEEDLNGEVQNVFHYLSLELQCRQVEQFYGLTSDSLSIKSVNARRQACRKHSTVCPCYEEEKSLALEEYI